MSTSSSTCLELLPSESSGSTSPKLSWLHGSSAYCDVEFSLNASLSPRGPIIIGVAGSTDRKLDFKHQSDVAADGFLGERVDMNFLDGPLTHPNPYKAIRSRPLRSFPSRHHRCQTYSHPPLQTLYSWNLEESSFELPQPTSPTRPRRSKQGSWLVAFDSRFRRLRSSPSPAIYYLSLYFGFNLGLTLYNKSLLIQFPFPYTLSAIHALCGSIGSIVYIRAGSSPPPTRLNLRETLILVAFSLLYTINIIISNVSLGLVTVPFHQVVRASTPLFTIIFSSIIIGDRSSHAKLIALIPVVAGVGFATYGDYYFTPWGFCLTLLGTILAALKTIYTNVLQAPSKSCFRSTPSKPSTLAESRSTASIKPLPAPAPKFPTTQPQPHLPCLTPLYLLHLLSPLAFIQTMLIAHFSGELSQVLEYTIAGFRRSIVGTFLGQPPSHGGLSTTQLGLLIANGAMAFGLNVVSFTANKKVGAVSMTVAANVKQVLTILCAVVLFNLTITPTNALGIVLTLIGGAIYTAVELKERGERLGGRKVGGRDSSFT